MDGLGEVSLVECMIDEALRQLLLLYACGEPPVEDYLKQSVLMRDLAGQQGRSHEDAVLRSLYTSHMGDDLLDFLTLILDEAFCQPS